MCMNRKDEVQAAKCLSKAVQADPGNLQIHQRFYKKKHFLVWISVINLFRLNLQALRFIRIDGCAQRATCSMFNNVAVRPTGERRKNGRMGGIGCTNCKEAAFKRTLCKYCFKQCLKTQFVMICPFFLSPFRILREEH